MSLLWFSLLLCLVAGVAINSGNVCVVRAANELATGKPRLVVSSFVTVTFATLVVFIESSFGLLRHLVPLSWPVWTTLLGAVIFACGALLNGACAVGTLGRLASGDVGYVATLVSGITVTALLIAGTKPIHHERLTPLVGEALWLVAIVTLTLALIALTWRHMRAKSIIIYAVLGIVAATQANIQGNSSWFSLATVMRQETLVAFTALSCFGAMLAGACLSALYRRRFRFVRPKLTRMQRQGAGGALMAVGAILIPGGNDTLLITGLPAGDPNAIVAYAVMFLLMFGLLRYSARLRASLADWSLDPRRPALTPVTPTVTSGPGEQKL